jgi:hypothetical protein
MEEKTAEGGKEEESRQDETETRNWIKRARVEAHGAVEVEVELTLELASASGQWAAEGSQRHVVTAAAEGLVDGSHSGNRDGDSGSSSRGDGSN